MHLGYPLTVTLVLLGHLLSMTNYQDQGDNLHLVKIKREPREATINLIITGYFPPKLDLEVGQRPIDLRCTMMGQDMSIGSWNKITMNRDLLYQCSQESMVVIGMLSGLNLN